MAGVLLAFAIVCLGPAQLAPDDGWTSFEFGSYNREYVDLRTNAEWRREGPVSATVRSPAHRLTIRDHSLDLRPLGDGIYEARVRVNFFGEGDIVAEVDMAGANAPIEDHVTAPPQEVEVASRLRFVPIEGGYEFQVLDLPESVDVEIESQLGDQLLAVCTSALSFLGVRCDGLDAMFSTATVPLPEPGGTYYISASQLSDGERARLDRFLALSSPQETTNRQK